MCRTIPIYQVLSVLSKSYITRILDILHRLYDTVLYDKEQPKFGSVRLPNHSYNYAMAEKWENCNIYLGNGYVSWNHFELAEIQMFYFTINYKFDCKIFRQIGRFINIARFWGTSIKKLTITISKNHTLFVDVI